MMCVSPPKSVCDRAQLFTQWEAEFSLLAWQQIRVSTGVVGAERNAQGLKGMKNKKKLLLETSHEKAASTWRKYGGHVSLTMASVHWTRVFLDAAALLGSEMLRVQVDSSWIHL